MRIVKHVLALCAVVLVTACGVSTNASETIENKTRVIARDDVIPVKSQLLFGRNYRFADGIVVSVSTPRSFQPSDTAYPQSERAVAFEVLIKNDSVRPYRLSGLSVTATVEGSTVKQVVDPAQGFAGVVGADRDIPLARDVHLSLAFAVPVENSEMQLALRSDPANLDTALYCGAV